MKMLGCCEKKHQNVSRDHVISEATCARLCSTHRVSSNLQYYKALGDTHLTDWAHRGPLEFKKSKPKVTN